ncbi:MAG: hypothetical protein U0Q16_06100 [Bryobacteraceae bacterium]
MLIDLIALLGLLPGPPLHLFACGFTSKSYVVGAPLPPSGLFALSGAGEWAQTGFNHPNIAAADFDPRHPDVLYLAAGNGCIRASAREGWRILTDWRVTEVQDVSLDTAREGHIYIALPDGIAFSGDGGRTWTRRERGLPRKFAQTIQVDRTRAGRVIAGTEKGIFVSTDEGGEWRQAGAAGLLITDVEQSQSEPRRWMATAQAGGLFASTDNGASWPAVPALAGRTLYNVSLDPHRALRAATCGWSEGVLVSEDGGVTWADRSAGLPSRRVWRVSFDPGQENRLWASVHEEAVFVSDDLGRTWRRSGLEGSIIRDFVFVPGGSR